MPLPFQTGPIEDGFENINITDYDRTPSFASWSTWSKKLFTKRKLNPADNWRDFEPTKNTSEYMYTFEEESGDDDDDDDDSYDEEDYDKYDARNPANAIS